VRQLRHPLSGAIYEENGDGLVRVSKDGQWGTFTAGGEWVDGPLKHADPHVCLWVGGRQVATRHEEAAQAAAAGNATGTSSGAAMATAGKGES
jgi:hypothetical protein